MWKSLQHNEALGPFSLKHRGGGGEAKAEQTTAIVNPTNGGATNGGDAGSEEMSVE
jgi:hypothetical protein